MDDKNKKRDPMPPPDATPEKSGATDQSDPLSVEQGWRKLKSLIQSTKPKEFEKLTATLLASFLEIPFDVAGSGDQPSGDAKSLTDEISVQTKRYTTTKLNLSSIEGEIHRVMRELTNLQFYVLAVSREISSQQRKRFSDIQNETYLDIVVLELTDELSDLGALCVTLWKEIREFFAASDMCQNQAFLDWIKERKDDSETEKKIQELRFKLKYGIQTQIDFQKEAEEYLLRRIGDVQDDNPRSNRSIDLSKAKDRHSLESKITNWWEEGTEPVCYLEGEKNSGKTWLAAKWIKSVYNDENMVPVWLDINRWRDCEFLDDLLEACFKSIFGYQVEKQIPKLKHKICNTWDMPTLIILDGLSERESTRAIKSILDEYFEEYHNGGTKWGHKISLLLTTRPFKEHQSSENYLWKGCCPIQVELFGDTEPQTALATAAPQLINTSNLLSTIAEIPRYSQICTRLQSQFDSLDMNMVLWADLLERIEHTDSQVRAELGWNKSENAPEILAKLAKQTKWANLDQATPMSATLLKRRFSNYHETRHDLEKQRVELDADDIHVRVNQDHILLGWALYLSNIFDCQEFTTIKDLTDRFERELEPLPSEDPRTNALFIALQISAVFPKVSQKSHSQKRSALISMFARFNNDNPQLASECLLFWAEQDTDAYAQAVEFEFEHHNSRNYEEALIEPLAKIWLNKTGQLNRLESRLRKWFLPTYADDTPEEIVYTHTQGQRLPREKDDIQFRLLDAALSILSQRPDTQFLEPLARRYGILQINAKSNKDRITLSRFSEKIGKLMRWGYTEAILDDLCLLAEQSESDDLLLKGIYGLAYSLCVNLPLSLERLASEEDIKRRTFVEKLNRRSKPHIDRIRNQERLLIGDSPAANGKYHGLAYLAVRTDLPDLPHQDHVEIKKILQDVSVDAKLGWSRGATLEDFCIDNLLPWVAKYDSESYAELACALKLNTLNQEWAQFKLWSIQGLIFKPEDHKRVTTAILGMRQRLSQGKDFYQDVEYLTSLLTETLLFSASEDRLTDWFEFLASHESLRESICYEPLPYLLEELLPESIVKLARQKLEELRFSVSDNQPLSNGEPQEFSEEEFWCTLYAYGTPVDENSVKFALSELKLRKPDSTGTYPMLRLALSNSKHFLDEMLIDGMQIDERIQNHLFSHNGRRFIPRTDDKGENIPSYEVLRGFLPPEIVGSFLCLPDRRDDLSRWGKDLMDWMYSILQGTHGDSNSVENMRFVVNPKALEIWAKQNTTDFLQLADKYFTELSKSPWYDQVLSDFTDAIRCLLLRFQPDKAKRYYHQWNAESFKTVYRTRYGVPTLLAQLWKVEYCNSPEHRQFRRELLEECLNDEDIMFMTLAALVEGGRDELWSLVKDEYLESHCAKERNLGVSILPWFGTCEAIKQLEQLKSNDPSQWVRENAIWAYEMAQQERSCQEVYRDALQTRDLFRISAVFEQIKPALSPTARWWRREVEKKELGEELQDLDSKLAALVDRFWNRWGNSTQTKRNIEISGRKLREYYRGEKLSVGSPPRIAPWWKPTSDSDNW